MQRAGDIALRSIAVLFALGLVLSAAEFTVEAIRGLPGTWPQFGVVLFWGGLLGGCAGELFRRDQFPRRRR